MPLPPHVEKPFNSKVIKSFVPELRSRKCFCVSGFLCYLHMSYEHFMYISRMYILCTFHVWLRNIDIIWCRRPKHVVHGMITNWVHMNQRDDQET